jgi:hypothetical protein
METARIIKGMALRSHIPQALTPALSSVPIQCAMSMAMAGSIGRKYISRLVEERLRTKRPPRIHEQRILSAPSQRLAEAAVGMKSRKNGAVWTGTFTK